MTDSTGALPDSNDVRALTGVRGLDTLLAGGFPANRLHLIEGHPGSGKTTLALQFLLEGRRLGETCLYVTMSETSVELRGVAASHGWSLEGIEVFELSRPEALAAEQYTLYHPSEIELGELSKAVLDTIDRIKPTRIVLDSLSEMRLLARDPLRYRRQILAFKEYFARRGSHGPDAGRSHRRREGPAAAEHRPRRRAPRAGGFRVWPVAPPPPDRQGARRAGHRGLPRFQNRAWRAGRVSHSCRLDRATHPRTSIIVERRPRARSAARRRPHLGHLHLAARSGRCRQVDAWRRST